MTAITTPLKSPAHEYSPPSYNTATATDKAVLDSARPTELTPAKYIELIHDEMSAYIKSNNTLKNLTTNEQIPIIKPLMNTIINLMGAQSRPDESIVSALHDNQTITVMLENINALLQSKEVSDQAKSIALKQLCCQGSLTPHFKVNQLARANITLAVDHADYTGELQSQLSQSLLSAKIAFIHRYSSDKPCIDDLELVLKEELGLPLDTSIETSDSTSEATRKTFTNTSRISHLQSSKTALGQGKIALERRTTSDQQEFLAYVRNRISPSETLKLLATTIKKDSKTTDTLEQATLSCKTYSKPTLQPNTYLNLNPKQQPIAAAPLTVHQWSTESSKDVLLNRAHEDATSIRYPTSAKQLAMPAEYCFKACLSSSESTTASTHSKEVFSALSEDQIHYCLAQNILARRAGFTEVIKIGSMCVPNASKICSFANLYYGLAGPHSPSEPAPLTIQSLQLIDLKSLPADVALAFLTTAAKQVDSRESLQTLVMNNQKLLEECSKEVRDGFASALGNQLKDLRATDNITLDDIYATINRSTTIHVIDFIVDACADLPTRECESARVVAIHRMTTLDFLKFSHKHSLYLNSNAISTFMLSQLSSDEIGIIFTKAEQTQRFHDYCAGKTFNISNASESQNQEDINTAMSKLIINDASICQAKLKGAKDVLETPLHVAVTSSNTASVKFICEHQKLHQLVTQPNSEGFYPLHYAARNGNIKMLKLLVEQGEDITLDRHNHSFHPIHSFLPIHSAIVNDKPIAVKTILAMPPKDKDLKDDNIDETACDLMYFTIKNGSVNVLKQLIQWDDYSVLLDIKTMGKYQWTPYLTAVAFNQIQCMAELKRKGVDVKAEGLIDDRTYNALSLAAHFGHVTLIVELMKADEITEESQLRALFAAAEAGQFEALTYIIDRLPANVKIPFNESSKNTHSSKDIAKQHFKVICDMIQSQKLTGVTPQILATKESTIALLYAAVERGDIEETKNMLQNLTSVIPTTTTNQEDKHLLQVAIDSGHHKLIPILAAHPLVPKDIICVYPGSSPTNFGKYPILFYVQTDISMNRLEIEDFKTLVSHCNKSQLDTRYLMPPSFSATADGLTALHFALVDKRIAHAQVLIAAGADKKAIVGHTFASYCKYRYKTPQEIATLESQGHNEYRSIMELLNNK